MDNKTYKKSKFKIFLSNIANFIFNPHFLLCFGIAWLITNGWSYIMLGIGTYFGIKWMIKVASAYLAFLWLPISPEKIVTFAISIGLIRIIFPKDEKTLGQLKDLLKKAKNSFKKKEKTKDNEIIKESENFNNVSNNEKNN